MSPLIISSDCDDSNKPNLFSEVLRPRCSSGSKPISIQVEIHVNLSPKEIKASIILNQLRLIGIFDLLLSLKCFVFDKLPEEQENGGCGSGVQCKLYSLYSASSVSATCFSELLDNMIFALIFLACTVPITCIAIVSFVHNNLCFI